MARVGAALLVVGAPSLVTPRGAAAATDASADAATAATIEELQAAARQAYAGEDYCLCSR